MNRKRLWLALALGMALVLLCAGSALADSLKFNMELSSSKFTEPKTITISFTVTNVGDKEMPGPVTLYYPSGKQVEEFGSPTLGVGDSKNWSGPWSVTQKELEAGKISFIVRYSDYDENGELKQYASSVTKHIQYAGAAPIVEVKRSIVPQTAQEGQEVSVIYEITNKGPADISSVTIRENAAVSKETATVGAIKAGETVQHTFTVKMGKKNLTSLATVSYKAGGKTYTSKVDEETIKYGKVNLSASLTADKKGGAPGDIVKLTLKLVNSGTTDFTNVTVTDKSLGTVFSDVTVKSKETVTLEKELTVTETQELLFTVTADDGTGGKLETATGTVKVIATDPAQQIVLRVEATADRESVTAIPGGIVRFTITVYNDSAAEVSGITIKAVDTTLYTFDKIPAGESRSFTRDTEISMAGSFQFTANVKDQLGQTVSFPSNIIPIAVAAPTAAPTATPVVLPPKPVRETLAPAEKTEKDSAAGKESQLEKTVQDVAGIAKYVLSGIAAVLLILLIIGTIRRMRSKSQSNKAIDHLDGAVYRDYSTAPKGKRRSEITSGAEENRGAAAAAQQPENGAQAGAPNNELMAETLQRLYSKPAEEAAAPAEEQAEPAAEEAPRHAAAPAQQEAPAVESAGEAAHRRRARK